MTRLEALKAIGLARPSDRKQDAAERILGADCPDGVHCPGGSCLHCLIAWLGEEVSLEVVTK